MQDWLKALTIWSLPSLATDPVVEGSHGSSSCRATRRRDHAVVRLGGKSRFRTRQLGKVLRKVALLVQARGKYLGSADLQGVFKKEQ